MDDEILFPEILAFSAINKSLSKPSKMSKGKKRRLRKRAKYRRNPWKEEVVVDEAPLHGDDVVVLSVDEPLQKDDMVVPLADVPPEDNSLPPTDVPTDAPLFVSLAGDEAASFLFKYHVGLAGDEAASFPIDVGLADVEAANQVGLAGDEATNHVGSIPVSVLSEKCLNIVDEQIEFGYGLVPPRVDGHQYNFRTRLKEV